MGISPIHFHDIHRSLAEPVEFVRSPQGRLVGRESIGFLGVLHRDPPLVDLLHAQIGSVGKPLEDIALRLAAIHGDGQDRFQGPSNAGCKTLPLKWIQQATSFRAHEPLPSDSVNPLLEPGLSQGGLAERIPSAYALLRMYTDWSSVILLLLTAVPLGVVVAVTGFFIWKQQGKRRT